MFSRILEALKLIILSGLCSVGLGVLTLRAVESIRTGLDGPAPNARIGGRASLPGPSQARVQDEVPAILLREKEDRDSRLRDEHRKLADSAVEFTESLNAFEDAIINWGARWVSTAQFAGEMAAILGPGGVRIPEDFDFARYKSSIRQAGSKLAREVTRYKEAVDRIKRDYAQKHAALEASAGRTLPTDDPVSEFAEEVSFGIWLSANVDEVIDRMYAKYRHYLSATERHIPEPLPNVVETLRAPFVKTRGAAPGASEKEKRQAAALVLIDGLMKEVVSTEREPGVGGAADELTELKVATGSAVQAYESGKYDEVTGLVTKADALLMRTRERAKRHVALTRFKDQADDETLSLLKDHEPGLWQELQPITAGGLDRKSDEWNVARIEAATAKVAAARIPVRVAAARRFVDQRRYADAFAALERVYKLDPKAPGVVQLYDDAAAHDPDYFLKCAADQFRGILKNPWSHTSTEASFILFWELVDSVKGTPVKLEEEDRIRNLFIERYLREAYREGDRRADLVFRMMCIRHPDMATPWLLALHEPIMGYLRRHSSGGPLTVFYNAAAWKGLLLRGCEGRAIPPEVARSLADYDAVLNETESRYRSNNWNEPAAIPRYHAAITALYSGKYDDAIALARPGADLYFWSSFTIYAAADERLLPRIGELRANFAAAMTTHNPQVHFGALSSSWAREDLKLFELYDPSITPGSRPTDDHFLWRGSRGDVIDDLNYLKAANWVAEGHLLRSRDRSDSGLYLVSQIIGTRRLLSQPDAHFLPLASAVSDWGDRWDYKVARLLGLAQAARSRSK